MGAFRIAGMGWLWRGGPAAVAAAMAVAAAVVTDAGGDVLISDTGNDRIREAAG